MIVNNTLYHEVVCNITSFNTTEEEFVDIVTTINMTLTNNSLSNVNVLQETVIIGSMTQ